MFRACTLRCCWLCWFCAAAVVHAWNPEGHERIARICEPLLKGIKKDKIRSVLQADVIDVSDWEAKEVEEMPECQAITVHKQDQKWGCQTGRGIGTEAGLIQCDGNGAEPNSLICGFAYWWELYVEERHLRGFPKPVTPMMTPPHGAADCFFHYPKEKMKPENYMRWVVMAVGNMHQPLHWATQYKYGKMIQVYHDGNEMSLFNFWEDFIAENISSVNGKWINLPNKEDVAQEYVDRVGEWKKQNPLDLIRDWSQDVSQLMCGEVFGPIEENKQDGSRTVKTRYKLEDEVVKGWIHLAKKLTKMAAMRLAYIFEAILDHRKKRKKGKGKDKGAGKGGAANPYNMLVSSPSPSLAYENLKSTTEETTHSTHSKHPPGWIPPWRTADYQDAEFHHKAAVQEIYEHLARLEEEEEFPHGLPAPSLHTGLIDN
mmetsp:Transcript_112435/g.195021  ORF Transcript_112435/g.195021 Transcript_112435/m.195021 type:complete len:429 (+) Transcript_112435:101-1387(+)